MKRIILSLFALSLIVSISSCRETTGDKVEEAAEAVGEDIENAAEATTETIEEGVDKIDQELEEERAEEPVEDNIAQ